MSLESSRMFLWAERLSFLVVSSENQRSTRSSQLLLVGVKWKWNRGFLLSQRLIVSVL